MRSLALAFYVLCAVTVGRTAEAGGKMELPPVKVKSTVRGAYEVSRSGARVGREDFIRTMMSNNTVVYESVFEVAEGEGTVVSGNNRLEVEEDSGFPRSYFTRRRTQGPADESLREVTVEMYTNVAVVSERQGDRDGERVLVLPTGCLFMEGNTAGHLAAVLARYDREAGGKQSFRSFDPLGVATTDIALEDAGDSTLVLTGEAAPGKSRNTSTEHFRYRTAGSPVIDFFVDDEERIIRIDTGPGNVVYTLVSHEEKPGSASPVK